MATIEVIRAAHQRQVIGASSMAQALGISRWGTALDLYLRLAGLTVEEDTQSTYAEWGHILEPTILRQYAGRQEAVVLAQDPVTARAIFYRPDGTIATHRSNDWKDWGGERWEYLVTETLTHPEHKWMICHLDGVHMRPDDVLGWAPLKTVQAKSSSAWMAKEWGEEGSDEVQPDYMIQVQQEMLILRALIEEDVGAALPALIGGNTWKVFQVEPDERIQELIVLAGADLIRRVKEEDPPSAERTERGSKSLRKLWPKEDAEADDVVAEPGTEIDVECKELGRAKRELKQAEDRVARKTVDVQELMGDVGKLVGDGYSITWRKGSDGEKVDWKGIVEDPKAEVPVKVVAAHTTPKKGSRSFRPNFKKVVTEDD